MPRHQEKRILPYTAEQMFDLVAAVDQYPAFLPWCKAARICERRDDQITADLIIGYKMFQERFTSLVTLNRPHRIEVQYQSGPLSRLSNQWEFRSEKNNSACEIKFNVDFDFKSPLLASVMEMFFDRALKKMVTAFEGRAKDLYS